MKIYIGYDSKISIASKVCEHSLRHHSEDLDIELLKLTKLKKKKLYWRPYKNQSTEFTYSRFLIPYLQNYKGWALYCDNDFLFLKDVKELMSLQNNSKAVLCVKHEYKPKDKTKMGNKKQINFSKKNWSSLMLINCGHPSMKNLDLSTVSEASGRYLHQFQWLDDDEIGSIPHSWNWLVNWYRTDKGDGHPEALHFTEGGPWIVDSEYKKTWLNYKKLMEEKNESKRTTTISG
jgi:lipopolysaccharide biosynthesis glycosyltransferase